MSAGFRVFLLILAAFGAIYAYRFRHPEISRWLKADSPPVADPLDQWISPVDRVLERDYSLARLVLTSPPPPPLPQPEAESGDTSPGEGEVHGADFARAIAEDFNDLAPEAETMLAEAENEAENEAVEAEPSPEPLEPAIPPRLDHRFQEVEYTVEPGDNLWKIAARKLGSGARHGEIREWNADLFRDQNPDLLVTGTVLKLRFSLSEEMLKVSPGDVDSTVEGNSDAEELRSESPRKSDRSNARSRRITRN